MSQPRHALGRDPHLIIIGQWVEPGGGIPLAVMSGRQAVQLMCADEQREFTAQGETVAEGGGSARSHVESQPT